MSVTGMPIFVLHPKSTLICCNVNVSTILPVINAIAATTDMFRKNGGHIPDPILLNANDVIVMDIPTNATMTKKLLTRLVMPQHTVLAIKKKFREIKVIYATLPKNFPCKNKSF